MIALAGLYLFLLTWRVAVSALAENEEARRAGRIELAFLLQVLLLMVLQLTGGLDSAIFPTFYLAVAMMVYFLGFTASALLAILSLGALASHAWLHQSLDAHWRELSAAVGFTLIFAAALEMFIRVPRERARRAQQTLHRLEVEAERFSRERPTGLVALSRDRIAKADLGALLQIDRVLADLADIAKRAMSAHTWSAARPTRWPPAPSPPTSSRRRISWEPTCPRRSWPNASPPAARFATTNSAKPRAAAVATASGAPSRSPCWLRR
jgi:hypothetical protein